MRIHTFILIVIITTILGAQGQEILPKNWLTPEQLENAEQTMQKQLDTGIAMRITAWDMVALRDARLLLIYLMVYERLPDDASRSKFRVEQQAWLQYREETVIERYKDAEGSDASLFRAGYHMWLTNERIAVLSKQLGKTEH
jgi:uncharacterized protein YecT (DUF1311 family)